MIDKNQVVAVRSKSAGGRIFGTDVNREPHIYESLYPEGYVLTLLGQLEDERAAREQWQKNCRRVEQLAEAAEERAEALAVENAALKAAMHPELIPDEVLVVFGDTAKYGYDSCDAGSWAWVENDDEVIKAVLGAMPKPGIPSTDAALAAIQAQGVEKFADDLHKTAMAMCSVKPDNTTPGAYAGMARSFAKKLREAK
ncbi:hypothetical protein ACUNE0_23250 [Serratia sp. IR-2025]|uniref:hypothetical protein n=1 Tax=Serratia TaxID=613 RepID=UPI000E3C1C9B|nr:MULTISPECIES: hypothetical protein [Serratia]MDR8480301.1 hypothetical protein [Serratia nevei]RFS90045.1 hypothetical protein CIB53_12750 [Serratia marcescens]WMC77398.1 hypothetical protein O8I25_09725 [Serratia nevei]WMC78699.1 hypothetical protein O8I24_13620 [Serratia nevei]